jgi:hypothetical protein
LEHTIVQEYNPGEMVPQSGFYTITYHIIHADMPHEVTVIKSKVAHEPQIAA